MSKMAHWFTQAFVIKEKQSSSAWGSEPYTATGFLNGFIQPVSGGTSFTNGKDEMLVSHVIYTKTKASVSPGMILERGGRQYLARYVQSDGIAGIGDHMEIGVDYVDGNDY